MKAINSDAFNPIKETKAKEPTSRRQAPKWVPLSPVLDHVKVPKIAHFKHGKPVLVHEYRDARGGLLDAVSAALRNLPDVTLPSMPRMANAVLWVTAAESALGWAPGTHAQDLMATRRKAIETSMENEPVAIGMMELVLPWPGTPTALHEKLTGKVPGIPKTVNALGIALARIKPDARRSRHND